MKRLAVLIGLLAFPAKADQIYYFFQFTTAAQAQVDTTIAAQYVAGQGWNQSVMFTGIQVWKPAQDVTVANPSPPPATLTTHTYLNGYYILGSLPSPIVAAALTDPQIVVIIDRTTNAIIKDNLDTGSSRTNINALQFSPVPAGSNYPFGAFQ